MMSHTNTPRRIEAIIFDLDDTLLDWTRREISWEAYLQPIMAHVHTWLTEQGLLPEAISSVTTVESVGRVFSEALREAWAMARETWAGVSLAGVWRETFSRLQINVAPADLEALLRSYPWKPMPGIEPYTDAPAILADLRLQGYKVGLITNSFQPMWVRDAELRSLGLLDYFDARITSGDTGFMKPHPAIYWRMLGLLNTTPERAVFVGDHPSYDIKGANLTGLTSVLIQRPTIVRELDGNIPHFTIQNLHELLPILAKLG